MDHPGRLRVVARWLLAAVRRRRIEIALSLRVTLAAVVALGTAQFLEMRLPLWVVLTALIVTQASVGRSLKTTGDYLMGTLGGALYGGAVAILLPHASETGLIAAMVLAVAPLALLAALRGNLNVLPITAIIVLLVPEMTHTTPLASAVDRVLEVGLGATIGLAASFLVWPSGAHRLMRRGAARLLDQMARAIGPLLAGLREGLDDAELHRLQDGIGQGLGELNALAAEAERERRARLAAEPDTGALRRTLLRLRHDLVMVGRTAGAPMPAEIHDRLHPRIVEIARAVAHCLRGCGLSLLARSAPPSLEPFEALLDAFGRDIEALRGEGLTRELSVDSAERFFAMGFALEQMHANLGDLQRVVREWSGEEVQ